MRLDVKREKGDAAEQWLHAALPLVQAEGGTMAWFALKFGRLDYGIFGAFMDDTDRDAHLKGRVAQALQARTADLFEIPPQIEAVEVISSKLPVMPPGEPVRKGLFLKAQPKAGHAAEMEEFIRDGRSYVQEESKTIAWFGLRLVDGSYGVFDVFPDNAGRLAHLAGLVPRELAKHALSLVGGPPDLEMIDVLAGKIAIPVPV